MKVCHLHFDASRCFWKQDTKKPNREQIKFCRKLKCPHGSITEKTLSSGRVAFVSCDLTWNALAWKPTSEEEREEMLLFHP